AALSCRAALAQFPQPETEASRAVAAACDAHAALVVRAPTRAALPLALLGAWRGAGRLGPRRWVPGGGAHPRAVVGHLLAALELPHQPPGPPDAILAPPGTGGTPAGLLLRVAPLGWPTPVIRVRVAPVLRANPFPTVELTVYPHDCDAFGHLNQATLLTLLERARWEALARGPGVDLFDRNGVWPAARRAVIDYKAGAYPRDVLRIETTVAQRGTTSMTLRHVVRRVSDEVVIAEAEIVFVCVDRLGRATPLPEEIARFL